MKTNGTAVVVGGSLGGLLAARVLSETFASVIVLDRDELPTEGVARKGVPQGNQGHGLLAKGKQVLDELFPGITAEVVAAGATSLDIQNDVRWIHEGHPFQQAPSDLAGLCLTRPLLEGHVRARVMGLPNVTVRAHVEVTGLTADKRRRRVTGVKAFRDGTEHIIDAELVVDATGRANRGPVWLKELGYTPAEEERVEPDLMYATRTYRRRPSDSPHVAILVGSTVSHPRSGIALWAEGDRWQITLTGMGKDLPPADGDEFDAFAAGLVRPDLYELIQRLEPLGPPQRMRIPASLRRRYERLKRFPEGLLVIGDALCQFNPAYGQGMTIAANEAMVLRDSLRKGRKGLAKRFFAGAKPVVDVPWDIAVGGDLRFPSVEGKRTKKVAFLNSYLEKVMAAASTDPVVGHAFLSVANLMAPPQTLFAPKILLRVLRRKPAPAAPATEPELVSVGQ